MKKQAVLLALAMFVIAWFSGTCMAMRFSEQEKNWKHWRHWVRDDRFDKSYS